MDPNSNNNICRICLNVQDTLFSLYRKRLGTSPYEKLISGTNLHIQLNDPGPASICSQCLIDLDTTISFLDKCERSNRFLAARLTRGITVECADFEVINEAAVCSDKPVGGVVFDEESQLVIDQKSDDVELARGVMLNGACGEPGSPRRCRRRAPAALHTCPHCQKTFNKKYNYQIHIKRHLGSAEWWCAQCGAPALTRWAAQRHCRPRARLPCPAPACHKTFTTSTNLQTHLRKHSGEKPFECDDCGKCFISKNILRNHMRTHTGVKPYMCQVCGKQFATNKLASHMWSHAARGAGREHACARGGCARAFRTARALRLHARAHAAAAAPRAHACALCHAAYRHKQSLNYHVKNAHGVGAAAADARAGNSSGVEPYACSG